MSPLLCSHSSGMNGPSFRGEFTCQGRVQERVHLSQIPFAHRSCGEKNVTFMATSLEPLVSSFTSFDKTVITKTMAPLLVCMFLTLLCEYSEKGQCVPPRSCAVSWQVPHRLCPWWHRVVATVGHACPSSSIAGATCPEALRAPWRGAQRDWAPCTSGACERRNQPCVGRSALGHRRDPRSPSGGGPGGGGSGSGPAGGVPTQVALAVNTVARQHLSH